MSGIRTGLKMGEKAANVKKTKKKPLKDLKKEYFSVI